MTSTRYLALAAIAFALPSCSAFKKKDPNYDTGDTAVTESANPYGVPDGGGSGEAVPYQPVNPPANANATAANPTYSPAAYEDNTPSKPSAPSHTPSHAPSSAPAHASSGAGASHVVAKGDTLGGIAKHYGVTSAAIKQANGMKNDTVVLGKTLVIPGASGAAAAPAARPAAHSPAPAVASHGHESSGGGKTHTVVKGDSLGKIASKYGTTAAAIKKANNMKSDTVVLGAKLRIP